jgi:hypothetical protein
VFTGKQQLNYSTISMGKGEAVKASITLMNLHLMRRSEVRLICSLAALLEPKRFAMSKLEWVELETLSTEASHLQSRIEAARAARNYGKVRLLEREMAEVSERRNRVLAEITNGLSDAVPTGPQSTTIAANERQSSGEDRNHEPAAKATFANNPTSPDPALATDTAGDTMMWDKLTAADFERIKRGLATRRSEILARHAQELKTLEAEQREIDAVEKAIAAFTQKFKLAASAEVVALDGERALAPAG